MRHETDSELENATRFRRHAPTVKNCLFPLGISGGPTSTPPPCITCGTVQLFFDFLLHLFYFFTNIAICYLYVLSICVCLCFFRYMWVTVLLTQPAYLRLTTNPRTFGNVPQVLLERSSLGAMSLSPTLRATRVQHPEEPRDFFPDASSARCPFLLSERSARARPRTPFILPSVPIST